MMGKICDVIGVRADGPAELWRNDESGRLVVRIITECGYARVEIDLFDLVGWLRTGPMDGSLRDFISRSVSAGGDLQGN